MIQCHKVQFELELNNDIFVINSSPKTLEMKSVKSEFVVASSKHNTPITLDINYADGALNRSLILFCHGFKGFKDWGHFNLMADYFVEQGFCVVKMNFSHNGTTPDHLIDFVDLEAFGKNNFSIELNDIDDVLTFLETDASLPEEIKTHSKLFILGHSKGGATSIVKFLDDERFDAAATLASVVYITQRYSNDEVGIWKKEGVVYIYNGRTDQQMPLYYQLAEDVIANMERLNIDERLKTNNRPLFMLHGKADETVSCKEAESQEGKPFVNVKLYDDVNHVFGSGHPTNDIQLPVDYLQACKDIAEFYKAV